MKIGLRSVLLVAITIVILIATVWANHALAEEQIVELSPISSEQPLGGSFTLSATYDVDNQDNTLTGLGLRFHFDSTKLDFTAWSNDYGNGQLQKDTSPQDDTDNFDGDTTTDKFLLIAWLDFYGNWPNENLPIDLVHLNFTVLPTASRGATPVNISFSTTAAGHTGSATNAIININGPTDSDGDSILDDGDFSGTVGDNPCTGGATENCDDNCLYTPNPDQTDLDGNGIGDVCDVDADGDGYNSDVDCNDSNASIHPGATEVCNNGVDDDCDGQVDEGCDGDGYMVTSNLWIKAVINTEEKGPIEAVWKKGGEDTTSAGDRVIWGHFYASPNDVTWGSEDNPDLYVKIWFDHNGRLDVNFFHVSVPDIEVYSNYPYDGSPDEYGTTTTDRRYIRQYYENGQSNSSDQTEDGSPPSGYSPAGNPFGYSTINDLRIGSIINTVEKGGIDAIWQLGGQDTTSRGDQVVWGHFYASPDDVTWGSQNNPDLFMKIWFDVSGRVDVNFFHVSVPEIEVYSALPDDGSYYDQKGTTTMDNRYIRHEY